MSSPILSFLFFFLNMCIVSIYRLNDYSLIVYNIYIQNTKLLILIAFNNYYYNNINTSKEREEKKRKDWSTNS